MIRLYISTFNNKTSWIKNGIPIEVGADIRKKFRYKLKDNTGDNISSENQYFGELTGLYWVWKNVEMDDAEIIGFCHYNKYLDISNSEIERTFQESRDNIWICTNPIWHAPYDFPEDMSLIGQILQSDYPECYYNVWKTLYKPSGESFGYHVHAMQLFYTTKKEFDAYCEFLFDVTFKLRKIMGDLERPHYYQRYCALMGEKLLDVYLLANHKNIICVPRKTNVKFVRRLLRKLAFLWKIPLLRKPYVMFRTSDFYDRYINEERSSWKE